DFEHYRPWQGESFGDVADRVLPALKSLVVSPDPGPLLVVAHAGVNRVILSRLQQHPLQQLFEIPQDYGAVNILRAGEEGTEVLAVNLRNQSPDIEKLTKMWQGEII
ncbi:MAG: hypothetical protein GXY53_05085, partial [Desulfobulbus sp.]|nr:hypothetical protein [Desulfobulbus sp.]